MIQKQYIYIGFNAEGQKVFWDSKKKQMLEGNSNVMYKHQNKTQMLIICLIGCLLFLGTYMLDIEHIGAEICLVISGVEGIVFAIASVRYTSKINALFFESAKPYEVKNKEEWVCMLKSGRKMVWSFIEVRLIMLFCAVAVAFLVKGYAEPFLLIFNIFIWWGLTYFFINVSVIKTAATLKYLKVK